MIFVWLLLSVDQGWNFITISWTAGRLEGWIIAAVSERVLFLSSKQNDFFPEHTTSGYTVDTVRGITHFRLNAEALNQQETNPECVFCLEKDVKRMWRPCGESGTQLWFKAHAMCESTISGFVWSTQHSERICESKIFSCFIMYFHFQNQVSFHDYKVVTIVRAHQEVWRKQSFSVYTLDFSGLLLSKLPLIINVD